MKRDIIDNYHGNDLASFLNHSIMLPNKQISVATGFFNIGGYALLRKALDKTLSGESCQFRLIIGQEVITEPKNRSFESLYAELEDSKYDEENKSQVDNLIEFLQKTNVLVRTNEDRFTHAKCYIFNNHAVVGSSNFTNRGLQKSAELNAVLYQPSHVNEVKDWFERIWSKGSDSKMELIEALDASKFGRPIEPHLMYMKMLYEYHRQRLDDSQAVDNASKDLTNFQRYAVVQAARILRKYKGVIIADSTGLGKTHIGIELLKRKVGEERKKTLLIAPKQVLDSVWRPRLNDEIIKVIETSTEKTGSPTFDPGEYVDKVEVVMIDESHNYRSGSTARHTNLMKILAGGKKKEVILLTATPINNSLMDLYYQLNLITAGDDTYFSNLGIANLALHFKKADKKSMVKGLDNINSILYEIMIKRTRQSIRENYPDELITVNNKKRKLTFPSRKLHKIEYSLTKPLGEAVYKKALELIDGINLVPYRIEYYNQKNDEEEKQKALIQSTLQQTFLMKRFESSIEAIRKSIQTLEKFYVWFEKTLNENKILDSRSFRKLLTEMTENDMYDEEAIFSQVRNNEKLISIYGYDKKSIASDVKYDLIKIRSVLKELERIDARADSKLIALKDDFETNNVFATDSKKVVIFTSFVDTANYIAEELRSTRNEEVLIMTGKTNDREREKILKRFAPKANNAEHETERPQILVSTDILSEGQNLQDCNYVINYDLPWNPMKIVQRVGRVDRLTSEFKYVTSAVFIPEKELDDVLKLLEKLQQKIRKIGDTVGHETPIIGEQARPKDFNAIDRIKQNDSTLIDDLEKSADMLSSDKPFDLLLKFIKDTGVKQLRSIPMGRRSARKSTNSGLIILYRHAITKNMYFMFYDYAKSSFEHSDDISWIFSNINCTQDETLSMPFTENEAFKQIVIINKMAKSQIIANLNVGHDAKNAQDIGSKKQRSAKSIIEKAFQSKEISKNDVGDAHKILSKKNMGPWDDELEDFIHEYNNFSNIDSFIKNINMLITKYKINLYIDEQVQKVDETDLRVVACMFLNGSNMNIAKLG